MRTRVSKLQSLGETEKTEKLDGVHHIEILKNSSSEGFEIKSLWNTVKSENIKLNCRGALEMRHSGLEWCEEKADAVELSFGEQGKFMIMAEDTPINIYINNGEFAGSCDIFLVEGKLKVRLLSVGSK